jgi:hypothetical protein
MPQILYTIDEYIATKRQKTTIWIVFNTVYNDVHAFKKEIEGDYFGTYLQEKNTDQVARQEFLDFMNKNFPDTKLIEVFDLVGKSWLQWPYLGSIAIDTDIGSDAYNALSENYGNPFEDATHNNKVLWVMKYEDAKSVYDDRAEDINQEFGDES